MMRLHPLRRKEKIQGQSSSLTTFEHILTRRDAPK